MPTHKQAARRMSKYKGQGEALFSLHTYIGQDLPHMNADVIRLRTAKTLSENIQINPVNQAGA